MNYRPKQYSKIIAITLMFFLSANAFASPCKDKEQDVEDAVKAVATAKEAYKGARAVAAVLAAGAAGNEIQDAIGKATGSKTRRGGSGQAPAAKAIKEMQEARKALEDAREAETSARDALQDCIDSHKCPACDAHNKKTDHFSASCETCDITSFYSCIHSCPGIPSCSSPVCNAKLTTDVEKAYHKQVICDGCGIPYYLCHSGDAEYHRPRVCQNFDGYLSPNGQYFYEYMGQFYQGRRICNSLYRNCSNPAGSCTIKDGFVQSHDDNEMFSNGCPSCSGIPSLVNGCTVHNN